MKLKKVRLGRSDEVSKALLAGRPQTLNEVLIGHLPRMVRFGIVGILGVGVNMILLYILAGVFGLNHLLGAILATEAAILSNFVLNDRWTFRANMPGRKWSARILRYNTVALAGLAISVSILAVLTYMFNINYLLANLFAIGAGTIWNYTGSSLFTWSSANLRLLGSTSSGSEVD